MAAAVNLDGRTTYPLWYRVKHPEFDPNLAYKALAYLDYGESADHQLLFVTHRGLTWAVKVMRCLCLNAFAFQNMQFDRTWVGLPVAFREEAIPWPKPVGRNPDLDDD
jgi:hypothetical protein